MARKQAIDGRNPCSDDCIREVIDLESKWKPIEENFQWGYTEFIYVVSENTPKGARLQYNKAH